MRDLLMIATGTLLVLLLTKIAIGMIWGYWDITNP